MGAAERFTVQTIGEGDDTVVRLVGELDLAAYDRFEACVETLDPAARRIDIDFADLTFMDSTGIKAVLMLRERFDEVVLRNPSPMVRRILEIAGVHTFISTQ